jgi:hypothetical protein
MRFRQGQVEKPKTPRPGWCRSPVVCTGGGRGLLVYEDRRMPRLHPVRLHEVGMLGVTKTWCRRMMRTDVLVEQDAHTSRVHIFELCQVIDLTVDDDPLPSRREQGLSSTARHTHQIIGFIVLWRDRSALAHTTAEIEGRRSLQTRLPGG